jgi:hypothetical protein
MDDYRASHVIMRQARALPQQAQARASDAKAR